MSDIRKQASLESFQSEAGVFKNLLIETSAKSHVPKISSFQFLPLL